MKQQRARDAVEVPDLSRSDIDVVMVLMFEDMAAARTWYDSPAYQAAKPHRLKGASCRLILVDGMQTPSA